MKFKNILIKTKDVLLEMLFPSKLKCIFCGRDIISFDNQPYCDRCAKEDYFNIGNRCCYCDMAIHAGNIVCDFCQKKHKYFDKAYCPLKYKDGVKNAILKFKSDNARYLAPTFASLIAQRIQSDNVQIDVIIPVPVHAKTKRARGYNQAEILAKEIAKILNVPMQTGVITKDKVTLDQKTLSYHERLKNVTSCFTLRDKSSIKDKNVLIVDDVMTTGATLNNIAKTLVGFSDKIYVCAIARDTVE